MFGIRIRVTVTVFWQACVDGSHSLPNLQRTVSECVFQNRLTIRLHFYILLPMKIHPIHLLILMAFPANVQALNFLGNPFAFVEDFLAGLIMPVVNTAVDELCDITLNSVLGVFNVSGLVSCDCGVDPKGFESLLSLEINGAAKAECTPGDDNGQFCFDDTVCAKGKVGVEVDGTLGVFSGVAANLATATATLDFNGIDVTIMGKVSLEDFENPNLTECTLGGTAGSTFDICKCNAVDCEGLAAKIQCDVFGLATETGCINPFLGGGG